MNSQMITVGNVRKFLHVYMDTLNSSVLSMFRNEILKYVNACGWLCVTCGQWLCISLAKAHFYEAMLGEGALNGGFVIDLLPQSPDNPPSQRWI